MKGKTIARACALAGAGVLAFVGGAQAQEGAFMRDVLGSIGIIAPERPPIDYRERPPLVLPPRTDLPPPVAGDAVAARNPRWPNDPDVAARRRRETEERLPVTETERRRFNEDSGARLSIDEMRAGRKPGAGLSDAPARTRGDNAREEVWVSPDVLRRQGVKSDEPAAYGSGPQRRSLTDPPTGLRAPAGGLAVKPSWEAPNRTDEADPRAYIRQQRGL